MKPAAHTRKAREITLLLLALCSVAVMLLFTLFNVPVAAQQSNPIDYQALPRIGAYTPMAYQGSTLYDEQIACTFTQNMPSVTYTVTAVAQSGTDGYGPAYLVNGLGNTGYWYQVGLSYDWGPGLGFQLNYEVFNPSGNSIFPSNGGGGLATLSPVNQGDSVLLSLSFSNGNVVMQGTDQNTGAHAQQTYSAEGATIFEGNPSLVASSEGFWTGLMTEWYHTSPYYGGEQTETYIDNGPAIASAWMWIEELTVSQNGNITGYLFSVSTPSPVTFTNPTQLQTFSSNGATESINATEFNTGGIAGVSTVALTFSYALSGGTGTSLAPILTYVSGGTQQTATLTQSFQTFSVDSGTTWSITNPTSSSTSTERWQTPQANTGIATSSQTINFVFYHQYLVTFGFNVIGGGTGYSPPIVTCQQFGGQITPAIGAQVWADSAQYNLSNPLSGSSPSERWSTNLASGTISSPGNINTNYYHQYLTAVSYAIIGGGTPTPPTLTSTAFNSPLSLVLTTQAQQLWIDSGASYSLPNTLTGSTTSERWQSSSTATGNVGSPSTISINYYHQYLITANYSITGGGTPSSPALTSIAFGSSLSQALTNTTQQIWVDSGASYSIPVALIGSTASERWQSSTNATGNVSSFSTVSVNYYHQYLITSSYTIVGGGAPGSPSLTSTAFGSLFSQVLTTQAQQTWIDSGALYSLSSTLPGSTVSERWQSNASASGNADSASTVVIPYDHQYYVTANSDPVAGGVTSFASGWIDAGASFQCSASANPGWQFESWSGSGQGSYSGDSSEALAVVNSPLVEAATFYPGLVVTTSSHVSVSYSYGATANSIPSGTVVTVYAPLGTTIQLTAKPKLFIYSFGGWTGSFIGSQSTISEALNSPLAITAHYSYNYVNIGIMALVAIVVITGLTFFVLQRRSLRHIPST